jgi:hypothetical protein
MSIKKQASISPYEGNKILTFEGEEKINEIQFDIKGLHPSSFKFGGTTNKFEIIMETIHDQAKHFHWKNNISIEDDNDNPRNIIYDSELILRSAQTRKSKQLHFQNMFSFFLSICLPFPFCITSIKIQTVVSPFKGNGILTFEGEEKDNAIQFYIKGLYSSSFAGLPIKSLPLHKPFLNKPNYFIGRISFTLEMITTSIGASSTISN